MPDVIDVDPGGTDHSPCRNCTHRASLHAFRRCFGGADGCDCPQLDSPVSLPPAIRAL